MTEKVYEILLDLSIVYAETEEAAYREAYRLMHENGNVDWSLVEVDEDAERVRRAAPALLAACEAAIEMIDSWGHDPGCTCYAPALRAAIAKAKAGSR